MEVFTPAQWPNHLPPSLDHSCDSGTAYMQYVSCIYEAKSHEQELDGGQKLCPSSVLIMSSGKQKSQGNPVRKCGSSGDRSLCPIT